MLFVSDFHQKLQETTLYSQHSHSSLGTVKRSAKHRANAEKRISREKERERRKGKFSRILEVWECGRTVSIFIVVQRANNVGKKCGKWNAKDNLIARPIRTSGRSTMILSRTSIWRELFYDHWKLSKCVLGDHQRDDEVVQTAGSGCCGCRGRGDQHQRLQDGQEIRESGEWLFLTPTKRARSFWHEQCAVTFLCIAHQSHHEVWYTCFSERCVVVVPLFFILDISHFLRQDYSWAEWSC